MKTLYSIKIKVYYGSEGYYKYEYKYYKSYGVIFVLKKIWETHFDWEIVQIKKLKRIYRKCIKVMEV